MQIPWTKKLRACSLVVFTRKRPTVLRESDLSPRDPTPSVRQVRQTSGVAGNRRLVLRLPVLGRRPAVFFELSKLVLLPSAATLAEDAFQQFARRLHLPVVRAPACRQHSFHRCLEDRGPIERQLVPRPLHDHDPRVQVGEQFIKSSGDSRLFVSWGKRKPEIPNLTKVDTRTITSVQFTRKLDEIP